MLNDRCGPSSGWFASRPIVFSVHYLFLVGRTGALLTQRPPPSYDDRGEPNPNSFKV